MAEERFGLLCSAELIDELESTGRRLSTARDFAASVPVWERLTALAPQRWEFALGLAMDLRSRGDHAEAEDVYRRASARFPDSFWILYHWALAAFADRDLDRAEQLAFRTASRCPQQQKECLILLGDIATRRRAFREAVWLLEHAYRTDPNDIKTISRLHSAHLYSRITTSFDVGSLGSDILRNEADYGVLIVSLDRCADRFKRLCEALKDSPVSPLRVPGIPGSYLPTVAIRALRRKPGPPAKGTAGCFLAHVAAWEEVIARKFTSCLILEDDAMPVVNLPHRFASLNIPSDFDLCFVNARMQPDLEVSQTAAIDRFTVFDPIESIATKPLDRNALGTDGYFLSAAGARKLLTLVERDGFDGDIDWRLASYSTTKDAAVARLPPQSVAFHALCQMDSIPEPHLRAFSLFPCLVREESNTSTRVEESKT